MNLSFKREILNPHLSLSIWSLDTRKSSLDIEREKESNIKHPLPAIVLIVFPSLLVSLHVRLQSACCNAA